MERNPIAKGLTYVELPVTGGQTATFYLAAEEFLAHMMHDEEFFFMWQVAPTVVVGRNQSVESEVDLDYCRRHDVDVCRRKSGGGAIYADQGNVMFSLVSPGMNVAEAFARYLSLIIPALRSLGLPAEASGRNDVLVGGRKVSGTAFYQLGGHSVVHGTMLYDTDRTNMAACLTPGADKLRAKGVASVPSRIGLLKDHLSIGIAAFKRHVRRTLRQISAGEGFGGDGAGRLLHGFADRAAEGAAYGVQSVEERVDVLLRETSLLIALYRGQHVFFEDDGGQAFLQCLQGGVVHNAGSRRCSGTFHLLLLVEIKTAESQHDEDEESSYHGGS